MDKNCVFLDKLAAFVSCTPTPPVCFAACQRTRSFNRPAPLAGLLYQASGDFGEWCVSGRPWFLPVNHLAIGCCHQGSASPESVKPVEIWAVAFNLAGIAEFEYLWDEPARESTPVQNPARLITAFQKTATRFVAAADTDPLLLKAALLELLAVARSEFQQPPEGTTRRPAAVTLALDWMSEHFHEPEITLNTLAATAGLSVHHFGRTFQQAMGVSAMHYLRDLRVRHSCGQLQGTALRINEIAYAVGFRDPLHFSRVFHEFTGQSPRAFRHRADAATAATNQPPSAFRRQ